MARFVRYTPFQELDMRTGQFVTVPAFEQFYQDVLDWLVVGRERRNVRVELVLEDGQVNLLSVSIHHGHLAVYQWGEPTEALLFAPFEGDARAVAVAGDPDGLLADALTTACLKADMFSAQEPVAC